MNRTPLIIGSIILLAALVGLGVYFQHHASNSSTSTTVTTPSPAPTSAGTTNSALTVAMTSTGFNPASFSVKKGDTVCFKNTDTSVHQPASDPHPTHTIYPEFDPKHAVAPGESWCFVFDRVGTWHFHDHQSPIDTGTVTVQ